MNNKVKVAAIGNHDTIVLFNAVGIKTFITDKVSEVERIIYNLVNENYKIIYVAEELYESIPETIEKYSFDPFPIIIPIPITDQSLGIGQKKIKENVEKAIGIDIF
ncbi:MAG TPA: V-type ATP synthase subunit F [Acholeplasmataceae bacterium]|jgi:V/A-type H+-transporting ATPase subunit F|nr:V-type ATP synthase subunit F [Acholeplasmataceae bacterium]